MAASISSAAQLRPSLSTESGGRWSDASLSDYRNHLTELSGLVARCAKGRDAESCNPAQVGHDDRVALGGGHRLVRYEWLRSVLYGAEKPDDNSAATGKPGQGAKNDASQGLAPMSASDLLQAAQTRLAVDIAQVDRLTGTGQTRLSTYAQAHSTMEQVLAGAEFRSAQQVSLRSALLEKLGNWLNGLFAGAAKLRARSPWVGMLLEWGFILLVCTGLVWGLMQLERRWRVRLTPPPEEPAPGAASARDWQLWLEDARLAGAEGRWREAIHFVYWAAISRLESRRVWPANRARTPREYLALVSQDDPRRAGLTQLTHSFEYTWYGGRPAGEREFRDAEEIASALISGGTAGATHGGAR